MAIIYHLIAKADWESIKLTTEYRAESLAAEGFIHCSQDEAQMLEVANRRFPGRDDLLVLDVDIDRLSAPTKYERSGSGGLYPHIYGPLNTDAVRRVRPLLTDPNGRFYVGEACQSVITRLANVTLVVRDYDEAILWYTEKLGLELRMDGSMGGDYRFVTVGVKGQEDVSIVLHKPFEGSSEGRGSHSLLFHTDDCRSEAERLRELGVAVTLGPEVQPWGVQATFEDPFGNSHVLLEPSEVPFRRGRVDV